MENSVLTMLEKAWDKDYSKRKGLWKGITNYEFDFPEKSKVLELGCGNGKTLMALQEKKLEVYAIDYSEKAVELCKELLPKDKARILVMDVLDLKFEDNFFDYIICFHLLAHLVNEDRNKAVQEIYRVLKKGGKVYFRDFGTKDFRFGMKGEKIEENTFKRHTGIITHYFTQEEVEGLFSKFEKEWFFDDVWKVNYAGLKDREELNYVLVK